MIIEIKLPNSKRKLKHKKVFFPLEEKQNENKKFDKSKLNGYP